MTAKELYKGFYAALREVYSTDYSLEVYTLELLKNVLSLKDYRLKIFKKALHSYENRHVLCELSRRNRHSVKWRLIAKYRPENELDEIPF